MPKVKLDNEVKQKSNTCIQLELNPSPTGLSLDVIVNNFCKLYHCTTEALMYLANLCYICHLWPILEMCFHQKDIGSVIYVQDQFFDVNSMVMSI